MPQACSREGERWFKNHPIAQDLCNRFLKPKFHNENWEKGIPHAWLKDEWNTPLEILQRYLTCEGNYALIFQYHIQILLHFEFDQQLNFPYYLWKSLRKMSSQVKKNEKNPSKSLYHHGLVIILIIEELSKRNEMWESFIGQNKFDKQPGEMVVENQANAG
jgi:hypothetical protein